MQQFASLANQELSVITSSSSNDFDLAMPPTVPEQPQSSPRAAPEPMDLDVNHEISVALLLPRPKEGIAKYKGAFVSTKTAIINNTLDSIDRAKAGRVLIKPNSTSAASTARTEWLSNITTRSGLMEVLDREMKAAMATSLKPQYLRNRVSYLESYARFFRESIGVSPWRAVWNTDMDARTRWREETWQLKFSHFNRLRYDTAHAVREAATHVTQFHLVSLQIVRPDMPRLRNLHRLISLKDKHRQGVQRTRRPSFKPKHITWCCQHCKSRAQDESLSLLDRSLWAVLRAIIAAGFQLLYRVGELAVGAAYDSTGQTHWSLRWLSPLLGLLTKGSNALIHHSKRKCENEWTAEMFPVTFVQHPANFVAAYQDLRSLFTPTNDCSSAFALADGSVPSAAWVCSCLRSLMRLGFPSAAGGMDYTDHCLRRGGETVLVFKKIDPKLQEQIGCWASDSSSRQLYMARVRETLVDVQTSMYDDDFENLQDDHMVIDSGPRGPSSAAAAAERSATVAAPAIPPAINITDILDEARDSDVESDGTESALEELASLDLDDEQILAAVPSIAQPEPSSSAPLKKRRPGRPSKLEGAAAGTKSLSNFFKAS